MKPIVKDTLCLMPLLSCRASKVWKEVRVRTWVLIFVIVIVMFRACLVPCTPGAQNVNWQKPKIVASICIL